MSEHSTPPPVSDGVTISFLRQQALPRSGALPAMLDLFPPEASHPVLLCCKAEGLYAHHEFEEAIPLLGLASVFDVRWGPPAFLLEFYLNNCALAAYKAGDADLALALSATAVERVEPGSRLAAMLCYNRAALLWDLGSREAAADLYLPGNPGFAIALVFLSDRPCAGDHIIEVGHTFEAHTKFAQVSYSHFSVKDPL